MPKSSSRKQKTYIQMRAAAEFKERFDAAREYKGWSVQTALEKVLGEWISRIETERGGEVSSPQAGKGGKEKWPIRAPQVHHEPQ